MSSLVYGTHFSNKIDAIINEPVAIVFIFHIHLLHRCVRQFFMLQGQPVSTNLSISHQTGLVLSPTSSFRRAYCMRLPGSDLSTTVYVLPRIRNSAAKSAFTHLTNLGSLSTLIAQT